MDWGLKEGWILVLQPLPIPPTSSAHSAPYSSPFLPIPPTHQYPIVPPTSLLPTPSTDLLVLGDMTALLAAFSLVSIFSSFFLLVSCIYFMLYFISLVLRCIWGGWWWWLYFRASLSLSLLGEWRGGVMIIREVAADSSWMVLYFSLRNCS